jgi:hypothetical protein
VASRIAFGGEVNMVSHATWFKVALVAMSVAYPSRTSAQVDSLRVPREVLVYVVCSRVQDSTHPVLKELSEGRVPHVVVNQVSYGSARSLLKECGVLPVVEPEGVSNVRYFMSFSEPMREGEKQRVGTFHADYSPPSGAYRTNEGDG